MKSSYREVVKAKSRTELLDFIQAAFTPRELSVAHVLCFPGGEGLEVAIYRELGVPPENIVCIERDRAAANELKRRKLGTKIHRQALQDFLDDPSTGQFDIISLDSTAQCASFVHALRTIRARNRLANDSVVFTNFCGAREADATKGLYAQAGWPGGADTIFEFASALFTELCREGIPADLADTLQGVSRLLLSRDETLPVSVGVLQKRSEAIHRGVRQILTSPANSLVDLLFRESDRDGSLTREVRELLRPDLRRPIPEIAREAAAFFRQQLALARKLPGFIPPKVRADLEARVATRVREVVDRAIQAHGARMGGWGTNWNRETTINNLVRGIDSFIGAERFVISARSSRYVSSGGTPMYADMLQTRRIKEFDELARILPSRAVTLDELLKPIEALDAWNFGSLIYGLERGSKDLESRSWMQARIPERQHLGCESQIRPRAPRVELEPAEQRALALQLMSQDPSLTNEDILRSVGAQSAQQIAGVRAHWTMGTYSDSVENLEACADRELAAGRVQSALGITKRLLRLSPSSARLLTKRAVCLNRLGKPRPALVAIRRALDIEPSNIDGRLLAGNMYRLTHQHEKAQQAFEAVLQVEPRNLSALVGKGAALLGQEKIARAMECFEGALHIDRTYIPARYGRAYCLVPLRGSRVGLAAFRDPLLEKTGDPRVWYNRGILHIHLNRRWNAIEDLSCAVAKDPEFFLAWVNLGRCFFDDGNMAAAHRAYSRAAAVMPGDIDTHCCLLPICYRLQRYEEFDSISKWLDTNAPRKPNDKVHSVLESSMQLVPLTFASLMKRAGALFDQQLYRPSIRTFRQVLNLAPEYSEARIGRAQALSRVMRFDEALDDLYGVLDSDPELPGIWGHIERMHTCAASAGRESSIDWLRSVRERRLVTA